MRQVGTLVQLRKGGGNSVIGLKRKRVRGALIVRAGEGDLLPVPWDVLLRRDMM
jgi:hypothetical protein